MNWRNLCTLDCPIDNTKLRCGMLDDVYTCPKEGCDFKINEKRLNEIVSDIKKPKSRNPSRQTNESALNNLGHRVVSEDYSDEIATKL